MAQTLIIVPCGSAKIWDKDPGRGCTPAREAYTGPPFTVNVRYAERFATQWRILSAKYGFIAPEFEICSSYNTTFKKKSSHPIGVDALHVQIRAQQLYEFDTCIGLGGKEYRAVLDAAFAPWSIQVIFPFAGLRLGDGMSAINDALQRGSPFPSQGHGA